MIKKITLSLAILVSIFALTSAITIGSGAPYGKTGSPGDGSNCTHCHAGTTTPANFITTNIPAAGYIPGTTYTITITATKSGINKFGFEMTAEDGSKNKVGSFSITNTSETKMVQDEVTHTGNGTAGANNQKVWTMDWTAPASGTGEVTFYSAVLAANGNGGTSGDQVILSNLGVQEDVTNTIANNDEDIFVRLFPTVAHDFITIASSEVINQVFIFDAMGKEIYRINGNNPSKKLKVELSKFKSGVYFTHIQMGTTLKIAKFIKE